MAEIHCVSTLGGLVTFSRLCVFYVALLDKVVVLVVFGIKTRSEVSATLKLLNRSRNYSTTSRCSPCRSQIRCPKAHRCGLLRTS